MAEEAWITGLGLLSCLGEGEAQHASALAEGGIQAGWIDLEAAAPFPVHPIRSLDLARYIPKKGDQRAMGPFMHYGVHAAGMALEDAGLAGNATLLGQTHLIAGCGGGERDVAVDEQVLLGLAGAADPGAFLNDKLLTELRPTLFLAQLPNLFAGNISIVHGVTGSSRTFMGEEMAGVDAVRVAYERLTAGQGALFLVGSAFNAVRPDLHSLFDPGHVLQRGAPPRLWARDKAGMVLGSMGAFLVLEARSHAEARGAAPVARLADMRADRSDRRAGSATRAALAQWSALRPRLGAEPAAVLSGATGAGPATAEERAFLASLEHRVGVRGTVAAFGHGMECTFIANLALAAGIARRQRLFPALDPQEPAERPLDAPVRHVIVTQWGHHRGEGMALVEAVD